MDNDKIQEEYNYKNSNLYDKIVIIVRKMTSLNTRLEMLLEEIKKADRATLEKIIEYIEQCLKL